MDLSRQNRMNLFRSSYFCLLAFLCIPLCAHFEDLKIDSEIAILMNADNRKVLYQKNADRPNPPASITKIATMLYTLKEAADQLDVKIEADQSCIGTITSEMQKGMSYKHPPHWLIVGGTHMTIKKGEQLTLEELLYGLILVSANDAANVIAKFVSGSISQFMVDLNDYLEEIGCTNTHFCNPHGLHFPKHMTTAYDMAIITSEAFKYPLFRKILSAEKYPRSSLKQTKDPFMYNEDKLLKPGQPHYYPYAIGGKTGNHTEAQRSLVEIASHNGRNLIAIIMQSPHRDTTYQDAKKLFEAAFAEKQVTDVYLKKGLQPFKQKIEGIKKPLKVNLKENVELSYYQSEKPKVTGEIRWIVPALPIQKGQVVAELILKDENENLLKECALYAAHDVKIHSSFFMAILIGLTGLTAIAFLTRKFYFSS